MRKKLVGILVLFTLVFCLMGCGKEDSSKSQGSEQKQTEKTDRSENDSLKDKSAEETETAGDEAVSQEDITYISCTADEMMQECVNDLNAAKAKYLNQYVAITGTLHEIELDENANPVGRVVRLDTSVEVTNAICKITGITWDEENVPLESFQKSMEEMKPGDTVTIKVYVDSLYDSSYDYYFDLYGVEK